MGDATATKNATRWFALGLLVVLAAAAALGTRSLDTPGLYYDEAVQARPALEFLSGQRNASPLPGSRAAWLGGRPFPIMTQPYMGALKSQVLMGPFAVFGARVEVLRATTLAIALLAALILAGFARQILGGPAALLATALLVFDPSFLLLARHDWGSFSISLLLRAVVLAAGWRFYVTRQPLMLWLAALALGLGFYNKIDFVVFAAGAGLALAWVAGRPVLHALTQRPAVLAGGVLAFLLGMGPLLAYLGTIAARPGALATPGEAGEKLQTLFTMLDGSHFHRLMESGGLFHRLGEVHAAPSGPLAAMLLVAGVFVATRWIAQRSKTSDAVRGERFVLLATLFCVSAYFALPGGVRIHHALNIVPFPHLLIAAALVDLGRMGTTPGRRNFARAGVVVIAVLILVLQVMVFEHTRRAFAESGGSGRWSGTIARLAADLGSAPTEVWSLDWGFHEPLAFLAPDHRFAEIHWQIPAALRRQGAWHVRAEGERVYVLHLPPYDRAGYGLAFLEAVEAAGPEKSEIVSYRDRDGRVASVAVRIARAHEIFFDGRFRVAIPDS